MPFNSSSLDVICGFTPLSYSQCFKENVVEREAVRLVSNFFSFSSFFHHNINAIISTIAKSILCIYETNSIQAHESQKAFGRWARFRTHTGIIG